MYLFKIKSDREITKLQKIIVFIIGLTFLLISCSEESTTNYEDQTNATVLGKGTNCGDLFLIEIDDPDTRFPETIFGKIFYANNLPENLKIEGKRIYVKSREPEDGEFMVCTSWGPAYSHIIITKSE